MRTLIVAAILVGIFLPATSPAEPTQWSSSEGGNDHWYEVVTTAELISWVDANAIATVTELNGEMGYLATITTQAENDWILGTLTMGDVWIGAVQAPGSEEPLGGWGWITDEPWDFEFWCSGEPANTGGDEDRITITYSWPRCPGAWNDASQNNICDGYLVEWDAPVVPVSTSTWSAVKALYGGVR